MAQRIEVVISAQDDYSAALQKFNEAMGKAGVAVNQTAAATNEWTEFLKGRMGPAMKEFGNHTDAIRALSAEYKIYKATGVAAHQAVDAAAGKSVSAISMLKSAWVGIAAAYIATNWLQSAVKAALDAEERYSKLRVQVEGLGIAFRSVEPQMQAAIAASSRYASVTGDEATKALQELIFHSGDYGESLRRLNLTLDLAYQKGISTSEAAVVMGRAIAGNTAGLARFLPELSNLDEKLGKFATEAERGAYSMRVMEERALGAAGAMTEHNKKLKEVMIAYDAVHQFVGRVIVDDLDRIVEGVRAVSDVWDELGFVFDSIAAKINPNIVAVRKNTDGLMDYEKAIRLVGSAHDKTADQMAAAILKESKAREQSAKEAEVDEQIRRAALMATNIEGGGSLQALILGDLDVPALGEKAELAGIEIGGKLAAGFAAAGEEQGTDPFAAATGDLDYNQKYITRLQWDQAYWDAYWAMQDKAHNKETEFEQMSIDSNLAYSEQRIATEKNFQNTILSLKFGAANQAVALLAMVGQKSKALMLAALVAQKALAMAQVWIQTQVASSAALAPPPLGLGPVFGAPLAASVQLWGKIQMGLIAATGLAEAAMGGGGSPSSMSGVGGGGGVGALPIAPPSLTAEKQRPQIIFQIEKIELLDESSVDLLMSRISERAEKYDVRLVASSTVN